MGLETGTRSLFLSGCLLSDEERAQVRDLPPPRENCWYHLQLSVFLYDFFNESRGDEFQELSSPLGRPYSDLRRRLDYAWNMVYHESINTGDRVTSIKSKCWILKGGEGASNVWNRLRDMVHFLKEGDNDIETRCDVKDGDFFRLVELLSEGARANNVERWQNKVPSEELRVWRMWIDACDLHLNLSQTAYVDWYLQFDESGKVAQYVAGFDDFPDEEGGWRSFEISDQGRVDRKRIPTSSSWAEPIPWNRNISIKYGKTKWDTLKPNDRDPPVVDEDESCLFHSANESLGVFVRYRSNRKDVRCNWWKRYDWDEQPELGSGQSDFLVCGRDGDAISRLQLTSESNQVEWRLYKSGNFFISNDNEEPAKIPFRIYRITNRPNDADVEIAICDGDREIRRIKVRGNSAHVTVNTGGNGVFVTSMGRDSYCLSLSDTMNLKVELPRESNEYKWTLFAKGVEQWSETCQDVAVSLQAIQTLANVNAITPFTLRCEESAGTGRGWIIGRAKGIIIPDNIAQCLCVGSMQRAGWIIENVCNGGISPIADRIEGFRRVKIQDPTGTAFEIGVPDNGFKWWFEAGHNSFMDMTPVPALLDEHSCVEEFSSEEIRSKSLCLPPDIKCDLREWPLTSSYFRRRVESLIDVSDFRYDPEAQARPYRFPGSEIKIFQYRFEPRSARLCADVNGRLGVYVPANDQSKYVAVAFSDKSADLLLQGKVIARICPDNRFTDIQDEWNSFCQDAEEHDALLALFEATDGHNSIICTNTITDRFGERLRLRRGVEYCVYGDAELSAVRVLKILLANIPENHPVREMHFFRTMQTQTSEQVRNGWRRSVETLIAGKCIDYRVWNDLFNEWLQSGFDPILEGVTQEVYEMMKCLFVSYVPLDGTRFEDIDQDSRKWRGFLRDNIEARDVRDDMIRSLPFWQQINIRRTMRVVTEFRNIIERHCNNWRKLSNRCWGRQIPDRNLQSCLQAMIQKADVHEAREQNHLIEPSPIPLSAEQIVHRACLDNNVRENEFEIQNAPNIGNQNAAPSEILSSINTEKTDLLSMFKKILGIMETRRRVAGRPNYREPTDREWIFCVAAATLLICGHDNVTPRILVDVLRVVRADNEKWELFNSYQGKCHSIASVLTGIQQ